jgi:hypothetical protein
VRPDVHRLVVKPKPTGRRSSIFWKQINCLFIFAPIQSHKQQLCNEHRHEHQKTLDPGGTRTHDLLIRALLHDRHAARVTPIFLVAKPYRISCP